MRRQSRGALSVALLFCVSLHAGCGGGDAERGAPASGEQVTTEDFWCTWQDYPDNPLIKPLPGQHWPDSLLADPTLVTPQDSPDGMWHLFAHSLQGIHHFVSPDGIAWEKVQGDGPLFQGMRPYVFCEAGRFYMLYERITALLPLSSVIEIRSSTDLLEWSLPTKILEPTLPWEHSAQSATTGNPFLMKRDGTYWLYYSANGVYLPDCVYFEPKYIGVATSDRIFGPYRKERTPIIGPTEDEPYRNLGAGSIKLLPQQWRGSWIAFNNGIYRDAAGQSRSAILVLTSQDGLSWDSLCPGPVIAPGDVPWKRAFVYAFDVKEAGGQYRMYYNARDGWLFGTERIGLALLRPARNALR